MYVLFISEYRLKEITQIHENVEPDDLRPFVTQAQDIYVQELLGTKFYNALKAKVPSNSFTTAERTLIDSYLSFMIANYSLYLALPSLNYKIKNKSVLNPSSEESLNTGLEEIKYLRSSVLDTAQFYAERTREFLRDNSTDFADYLNSGVDGMMPNKQGIYSHGVYIPYKRGCGLYPENPNPNSAE